MAVQVRLPRPHPAQQKVISEAARFNVLVCGRRWGKTELLLNRILEPVLQGRPAGWFAPNEKYFDEVWRVANSTFAPVLTRSDSQKKRLEMVTGGSIDFWTLHNTNDPGRGRKYAMVVVDEAAIVPQSRFEHQWQEAIRPTLTDFKGSAWFASTPKGIDYFKSLYDRGGDGDWRSWQRPTLDNPYIDPGEIENARIELPPLVFSQEYLAQFISETGAHFKPPVRYDPADLPKSDYREATGCDFAYTSKSGDYTVFVRGRGLDGKIYVTDVYREQSEINQWVERLKIEPSPFAFIGGQEKGIVQLLNRYGAEVSTQPAATDKLARAQPVIAAWNRGDVLIPTEAPWLDGFLSEVLSFTGNPRVDAHDDTIDALAALHHTLDNTFEVFTI